MEITKINEVVDKSVLEYFYAKLIPINEICTIQGAINIIDFELEKLPKIKGMISDLAYNQSPLSEEIDSDAKYTIIFNEKLDFTNNVLILKNLIAKNQYYVVENINTTFSPEKLNEVVNVAVCQRLEDYVNNKKFIIYPNVIDKPSEKINIKIRENFLYQKAYIENHNKLLKEIQLNKNAISMIVNPVEVNEEQEKIFMTSLSKFGLIDIRDICLSENAYSIYWENQYDERYKEFFEDILEIYEHQSLIMSGFAGKTKEEIDKFKEINYSGTNAEEYVNYKLSILKDSSKFSKEQIELLILMCSGFLKSTFCIGGGFSIIHKFILPFYFDLIGGVLYLKSEFYELSKKPELWRVIEDQTWKTEQERLKKEREEKEKKEKEEAEKRKNRRGEGRKRG